MKYFKPDMEIHHFTDLTSDWLRTNNVKIIFSDLDSTLTIHDRQHDDHELEEWIKMLKENDIILAIVSNNSQGRVDRFVQPLGIIGFGMCNKPATSKIKKEMKKINATTETSIFLGDQLFTDIWCGKRLGMRTVLVTPIGEEHEPWNIRLKRFFERIVKKRW